MNKSAPCSSVPLAMAAHTQPADSQMVFRAVVVVGRFNALGCSSALLTHRRAHQLTTLHRALYSPLSPLNCPEGLRRSLSLLLPVVAVVVGVFGQPFMALSRGLFRFELLPAATVIASALWIFLPPPLIPCGNRLRVPPPPLFPPFVGPAAEVRVGMVTLAHVFAGPGTLGRVVALLAPRKLAVQAASVVGECIRRLLSAALPACFHRGIIPC